VDYLQNGPFVLDIKMDISGIDFTNAFKPANGNIHDNI
jgi:hypothetical protein